MSDIKYDHVLDSHGACSCGDFSMRPGAAGFVEAAAAHRATTTEEVRQQTGWRGLLNKLRNRT